MARKTECVKLGKDEYVITQLGGEVGSDLWDDILAAAGPKLLPQLERIGPILEQFRGEDLTDEAVAKEVSTAMVTAFAPVILDVLTSVPKELKRRWRKLFAENTLVNTGSVELNMAEAKLFDAHFAGRYGAMTAWEIAHLKHNFLGDFLSSKGE